MITVQELLYHLNDYQDTKSFGGISRSKVSRTDELKLRLEELSNYKDVLNEYDKELTIDNLPLEETDELWLIASDISNLIEQEAAATYSDPKLGHEYISNQPNYSLYSYSLPAISIEYNPQRLASFSLSSIPGVLRKKVVVGQTLDIYDEENNLITKSIIYQKDVDVIRAVYKHQDSPSYAYLTKWWAPYSNESIWLTDSIFEDAPTNINATLKVIAVSTILLGRVGWSLYYTEDYEGDEYIEVARGTDGIIPGVCYLNKKNARFKPGKYKIKIRSALSTRFECIKLFKTWLLEEPSSSLIATSMEVLKHDY